MVEQLDASQEDVSWMNKINEYRQNKVVCLSKVLASLTVPAAKLDHLWRYVVLICTDRCSSLLLCTLYIEFPAV